MTNEETKADADNNSSMSLLGEYLKQKRLDKNFSLEKLSQKTKISINILKSLEANDYKSLPSAAYIKGFVKNYIKVLGLSQEEAITKMEQTYQSIVGKPFPALDHTKAMPAQPISMSSKRAATENGLSPQDVIANSKTFLENTKSFLPIIIFAAVILVFVGGYKIISSVVENEVNGPKNADTGYKIESSSALVKQPVAPTAPVAAPAETAATTTAPAEEKKVEEAKPAVVELQRNYPNVDFKKIRSKLFSVRTDAPENDDAAIFPPKYKEAMNSDLQNIYIRATEGNTWLSYKIDSNPIESVIIKKDTDLFLQGNEIRIFLGNVNVTKIFYNNYLLETPTKSGVKSLIFPEESNAKYMLPLFPKAKDDILYTAEDYQKRMKLEEEEHEKRKQAQ